MLSIGELIDKLIIENIKVYNLRATLHDGNFEDKSDKEFVDTNNLMNILNRNRNILARLLDEKIDGVISGEEKNVLLQTLKVYNTAKNVK